MKNKYTRVSMILVFAGLYSLQLNSQKVGIGVTTPDHRLHVRDAGPALLKLENSTDLNIDVRSELFFNCGGSYTGAIKTIGTGDTEARLGLFTYAGANPLDLEERLTITDIGNIGIDNISPFAPLGFKNVTGNKIDFSYSAPTSRFGVGVQFGLLQFYSPTVGSDIAFGYGSSTSFTETMRIKGSGRVGIGTTTPNDFLSFGNVNGDKINFWHNTATSKYGIGLQTGLLQFYTTAATSDIAFGFGSSAAFSELMRIEGTGNVGIGTSLPTYLLDLKSPLSTLLLLENSTTLATNVTNSQFFKAGTYFTGAIKTIGTASNSARMGFFTFADVNASTLMERLSITDNGFVGIGLTAPSYILDVNGRMRVRHNANSSGIWFMNSSNTSDRAFVGLYNDTHVGLYGGNGAGWNFVMNTIDGNVGIGVLAPTVALDVVGTSPSLYAGRFVNNSTADGATGLFGKATNNETGVGVNAEGYEVGVKAEANGVGSGFRFGVFAEATGGANNWAGYFLGNVYASGSFIPSDRKLKNEILPLNHALSVINQLKPSAYTYKTNEFKQMHLPEGIQYGLIADEVMQVLPGAVKKAFQPAEYENHDELNGRKLSDEVEFNAVNYTGMIPILIGAIQEQQNQINDFVKHDQGQQEQIDQQRQRIDLLESRLAALEKKLQ